MKAIIASCLSLACLAAAAPTTAHAQYSGAPRTFLFNPALDVCIRDTSKFKKAPPYVIGFANAALYIGSKHAVLVACIKSRADRMRMPPDLPAPRTREMLAATLTTFATNLVREVSHPSVIAAFRLAIAEATRSPEIAQALDVAGRDATREALTELLANAQSIGLIGPGEPLEMATQYLGLLWENLMVGLLLGVAPTPEPAEAERRAARATAAFMQLHPDPVTS